MSTKSYTFVLIGLILAANPHAVLHAQSAGFSAPPTSWADWTSDTVANPGSAAGTLFVNGNTITVTYTGEVFNQTETNGAGTDYYTPVSTYSNAVTANAPLGGMITFVGGNSTVDTITFSQTVTNPVMAIVSQGSPGNTISMNFNAPFNVLSTGPGWWGSGPALTQSGNTLSGAESDGVIQFIGEFNSISWTVTGTDSYYTGLTIGATNFGAPIITNVQGGNVTIFQGAPWSLVAQGTGAMPLTYQWSMNGTNLTNQSRVFGANSNALTFTNALVSDAGTYQIAVSNTDGVASSNILLTVLPANDYIVFNPYAEAVTNLTGLLGYWRFDPVFQLGSCVNGFTGTAQGNAAIGAAGSGCPIYGDPLNQALVLDGNGSFLSTSLTGQIGNQGSMLAWVYLTVEPSTTGRIFSVVNQSQVGNNYDVQIETDNLARFYAGGAVAVYSQPLSLNQWHFLAATLAANGTADLYVDGQLAATAGGGGHSVTTDPVCIGASESFANRYFQGRIDEVAIYNVTLTFAQIAALYETALAPPSLNIASLPGAVVVTWPTNYANYTLQTNSFINTTNWAAVPAPYGVASTNYSVTNPTGGSRLFYRLKN